MSAFCLRQPPGWKAGKISRIWLMCVPGMYLTCAELASAGQCGGAAPFASRMTSSAVSSATRGFTSLMQMVLRLTATQNTIHNAQTQHRKVILHTLLHTSSNFGRRTAETAAETAAVTAQLALRNRNTQKHCRRFYMVCSIPLSVRIAMTTYREEVYTRDVHIGCCSSV